MCRTPNVNPDLVKRQRLLLLISRRDFQADPHPTDNAAITRTGEIQIDRPRLRSLN
jgi:hypothetical protein